MLSGQVVDDYIYTSSVKSCVALYRLFFFVDLSIGLSPEPGMGLNPDTQPELDPKGLNSRIRIRNKSFRIHNTDFFLYNSRICDFGSVPLVIQPWSEGPPSPFSVHTLPTIVPVLAPGPTDLNSDTQSESVSPFQHISTCLGVCTVHAIYL